MRRKKSSSSFRPKSASNSFLMPDHQNKENVNNMNQSFTVFDDYSESSESDLSFVFDKKQKQRQKQRLRSVSAKTINSSSFMQENEEKSRGQLKTLYHSNKATKKKTASRRFMKPTLSAYLLTNNPSSLLASC